MSNHVDPTTSQFEIFKSLPRDEPIMMLNLIRLNKIAAYPDNNTISGKQAYDRYGKESFPVFSKVGGEIIWRGIPESVLIGPADEHWDITFIARYPDSASFLAMVTDPAYQAVVVHRQAAVDDSRLIRLGDSETGSGF